MKTESHGPQVIRGLAILSVIMFCVRVFSDNKADVDLWGNVGFVKAWPGSAEFRCTNTFSFTQTDGPWINHEWLAEYILHKTHAALGNRGLLALKTLLGFAVVAAIYSAMQYDGVARPVALLFLLLVISTMGYGFSTRPHHFTYLLLGLCLLMLKRSRKVWPFLVCMPLVGLLWANLHGAFFIGLIVLVAYALLELVDAFRTPAAGRPKRHAFVLLAAAGLFAAASLINPYGPRLWRFVAASAAIGRPYLSEWAPFNPSRHLADHVDFVVLAALSVPIALVWGRRKSLAWTGLVVLALAAALTLRRNIPLFAIVAGMAVPGFVSRRTADALSGLVARIPVALQAALLAGFTFLSAWSALTFHKSRPFDIEVPQDRFPVDTVRFMKANEISGNLLVFFDWAEYCIWHTYPESRVFMDGRFCSAYSRGTIQDYLDFIYFRPNWSRSLKDYPTNVVMIHKDNPIAGVMLLLEDWTLVHQGRIAQLYLKKAEHRATLARLESGPVVNPEVEAVVSFP